MSVELLTGDSMTMLRTLPDASVHCCVTSPPYFGLRNYGVQGQLGLEKTPEEYVAKMVEVFREVKRVLRSDGTLWLNLGSSFASAKSLNVKPKDLIPIPWMVAMALQADGWYLRSDIIWAKSNPMPESVTDRPTKAHEYVFLLTKRARLGFARSD
jgi:DNA modification methylase